nr:uncharacterized protein K02A2.6-like [Quercus suber]
MEGNFDVMALDTFKLGLPTDHGLRTSLSGKPVTSMCQLMDRIEKYKRVEEDQQQGKGKEKVIPQERRDFRSDRFSGSKPQRDFSATGSTNPQTVNTVFKEPRMMTRMFEPQLGRNIKIYIDDMVVKSKIVVEHVKDLESTFEVLREYKLCLNASKCSFGMGSGKFLGYMVTHRGIEVNPD